MKKRIVSFIVVLAISLSMLSFLPLVSFGITYENGIYKITSAEDFLNITDMTGTYWIINDITLPDDYIPLGTETNPFRGKIYGKLDNTSKKPTITLNINAKGNVGLIGTMSGGVISNIIVDGNVKSDKRTLAGGIVGFITDGRIEKCINKANVSTDYNGSENVYLGGIVGLIKTAAQVQIVSCENYGNIEVSTSKKGGVGGILGGSFNGYTIIESSKNEGSILANATYAGGIAGIAYSDIKNCANYGNIENTKGDAAGICVETALSVSYSFNKGNITAKENAGGISTNAKTTVCYNNGDVKGYNAGGISVEGNTTYSYNTGNIAGEKTKEFISKKCDNTCYYLGEGGLLENQLTDISSFPQFDKYKFRIDSDAEYKYPQIYANPYGTIMKDYPEFIHNRILIEAEDCVVSSAYTIQDDFDASGGKVVIPAKGQSVTDPAKIEKAGLSFEFYAPEDTKYLVWLRIKVLTAGGDSTFVSYDDNAYNQQKLSVDAENYVWLRVLSADMTKGVHTVNLYPRETNQRIDRIAVLNKASASLSGMGEYQEEGSEELLFSIPDVKPTVGEHPRLLFKKEDIPRILEYSKHPEHEWAWNRMITYAGKTDATGILPDNNGAMNHNKYATEVAQCKAMDYVLNGNETHGREAIEIICNYLRTVVYTSTGDYSSLSQLLWAESMVYDWCYDLMTEEEKNHIIDTTLYLAGNYLEIGWPPVLQAGWGGHGSEEQLVRDLVAFGIATYDEKPYIYNTCVGRLVDEYMPIRRDFLYNGHKPLYGSNYGPWRWDADVTTLHMMGVLNGGKNFWENDNLGQVPYWYIYATRPDGFYMVDGDGGFDTKATPRSMGEKGADNMYMMLGSWYKDGYLKYAFLDEKERIEPTRWIEYLVINDPTIEPIPYNNLPLSRYFPYPAGEYIARTGWNTGKNSDDVVVTMKLNLATLIDHNHMDAGEFEIFYKGALATDTGYYQTNSTPAEESSYMGTLYWNNYYKQTIAHNCMLILDPAERIDNFRYSGSNHELVNSGGQLVIPAGGKYSYPDPQDADKFSEREGLNNSKLLGREHGPDEYNPDYTYLSGDIARNYSEKVKDYERSFMFLNLKEDNPDIPAVLIVFDHVVSSNPAFKKTYLLHGSYAPEIKGTRTILKRTDNGYNGKLVNDTLLPKADNVSITQVGENPNEFWAGGKVFKTSPYPGNVAEQGGIRTEISPVTPSEEDYFLNVMQMSDADSTVEPLKATLIETDTHKGVKIADRVVLFGLTKEQVENNVSFAFDGEGEYKITVANLKAGTWTVSKDNEVLCDAVVTEDGTIAEFKGKEGNYTLTYKNENSVREIVSVQREYIEEPIKMRVNDFYVHAKEPYIENGRVMVPLRAVGDALNANTDWDETTNTAIVERYGRKVKVTADSDIAYLNEAEKKMDVCARVINDTMYVPLRFISEAFFASVTWYDYTKTVVISDKFSPPPEGYLTVAEVTWDDGELAEESNDGYATIDNNSTSAWATNMNEEGLKWLKYDFGQVVALDKVEILWSNPHQRYFVYDLLVSEDGVNWTVIKENAQSEVVDASKSEEFQIIDIPGRQNVRYVKLNGYRNTKHHTVNIKEVRFK